MIRSLFYIAVFAVGFAAGGLFPSFSSQYQLRLQAQYDQVSMDLLPFQKIANRYHGGSIDALVEYHLASDDPTFYAEGAAIQQMLDAQARLAEFQMAADVSYMDQAAYFYKHRNDDIALAAWQTFEPTMVTSESAITFALAAGVVLLATVWLLSFIVGLLFRKSRPTKHA